MSFLTQALFSIEKQVETAITSESQSLTLKAFIAKDYNAIFKDSLTAKIVNNQIYAQPIYV